jgi:hypothetical protein
VSAVKALQDQLAIRAGQVETRAMARPYGGSRSPAGSRPPARAAWPDAKQHTAPTTFETKGDASAFLAVQQSLSAAELLAARSRSLVKGVQVSLKAIALSIKPGAEVGSISVGGQVRTAGRQGDYRRDRRRRGTDRHHRRRCHERKHSDAIHTRDTVPGLDKVSIDTANGQYIVQIA